MAVNMERETCLVMKARMCPQVEWDFSGAWKQFWLDAVPDAADDSHDGRTHMTAGLKPRFAE